MAATMADISLRPQPLLAHWAPGAILTVLGLYYLTDHEGIRLFGRLRAINSTTLLLVALALVSFAIGQVLDAFRDGIIEDALDSIGSHLTTQTWLGKFLRWFGVVEVRWEHLAIAEPRNVENLEVWFFSHYMLSFNLGVGLLILASPVWCLLSIGRATTPHHLGWIFSVSGILLLYDALRLRSYIGKLTVESEVRVESK
jgi:hypothetical protein